MCRQMRYFVRRSTLFIMPHIPSSDVTETSEMGEIRSRLKKDVLGLCEGGLTECGLEGKSNHMTRAQLKA